MPDHLLGGRLSLLQSDRGHRAGTDAVLLAAAAGARDGDVFVDVGAGVGTAGLILALQTPTSRGVLLERDAASAESARLNCALNGVDDRLRVGEGDLFARDHIRAAGLSPEQASLVITNPPFFLDGTVRASPDSRKAAAHVAGAGGHGGWVVASLALLAPQGRFVAIHRPDALADLLAACDGRLGALLIKPVLPRDGGDAIRILLSGIKGSRKPLRLAAPLVLHGPDGAFTAEAQRIHRGDAVIAM